MFLRIICILAVAVIVSSKYAHSSQYVHQYVSKPQAVYIQKLSNKNIEQSEHGDKQENNYKEECNHQEGKKIAHSSQYVHKHEGHHQLIYINKHAEDQHNEHLEQKHQHEESEYHQEQKKIQNESHKDIEVAHSYQYVDRHDGIHQQPAYIHNYEDHFDDTDLDQKHYIYNQHHEKQGKDDHNTQKQQEVAYSSQTINRQDGHHQHVYILKKEHENNNNYNQQNKLEGDAQKHDEFAQIGHLLQYDHRHDGSSQQLHKHNDNKKEKQLGKEEHIHVDYYTYPKYEFEYKVDNYHTGDHKQQHEIRDGDKTNSDFSSDIEHIVPQKYSTKKHEDC